MKAIQQEVSVEMHDGQPTRVRWGERHYTVSHILDAWRYGGRWWLGEAPRNCYLVQVGPMTAELHREDGVLGRWWLARLQD